jgi:hypothetical protein
MLHQSSHIFLYHKQPIGFPKDHFWGFSEVLCVPQTHGENVPAYHHLHQFTCCISPLLVRISSPAPSFSGEGHLWLLSLAEGEGLIPAQLFLLCRASLPLCCLLSGCPLRMPEESGGLAPTLVEI